MEIDVIELAGIDCGANDARGAVRAEADEPASAFFLELPGGFETTAGPNRPLECLIVVDAVEAEQIDVVQPEIAHGFFERLTEIFRVGGWSDFGLDDDFFAGQLWQHVAELHFRRAVAACGLDVVDAEFECPVDAGFEVGLVGDRYFAW